MPNVQPEVAEEHWATQIYEALVLRGVDPHDMVANFEHKGGHVALAMPDAKVAIATDGDVFDSLEKAGWHVVQIPVGAMRSFASTARDINSVATNYQVRSSSNEMIKTGSQDEARLLNGILRVHLPPPDRNFRIMRPDNPSQELTVPDFTWPRFRIAFFLDGLWWHQGKDGDEHMKKRRGGVDPQKVMEDADRKQRSRASRDADNRSELALMGWTVLVCSDEDVADDRGVAKQVDRIKRAIRSAQRRARGETTEAAAAPVVDQAADRAPGPVEDVDADLQALMNESA